MVESQQSWHPETSKCFTETKSKKWDSTYLKSVAFPLIPVTKYNNSNGNNEAKSTLKVPFAT